MANVPITFGSGGGAGSDDCTGAKAQARAGYTFIASDTDDEPAAGLIADYTGATTFTPSTSAQTAAVAGKYTPSNIVISAIPSQHSDSGNVTLTAASTSKSYAAGWYGNVHGAQISAQSKSVTPAASAQTVAPDSGKVLSAVTVNAIPNQKAAATYTPSTSAQTIAAGQWLAGAQTIAAIPNQKAAATYTPRTSAQTIAASQWLLGAQTIAAIPNQTAGGTVTLTASTTSASRSSGIWLTSAFTVNVSVYDGSYS